MLLFAAPLIGGATHEAQTLFEAPPFETASTVMYDFNCPATENMAEAHIDGRIDLASTIAGPCSFPGAQHVGDLAHPTAFDVEDGRTYTVAVDYEVQKTFASSDVKMLTDFFLQLAFDAGSQHLVLDGVVARDFRARCWTEHGSECQADGDMAPGNHKATLTAVAECGEASTCSVPFHAYVFSWSFPYPETTEVVNGTAAMTLRVNHVTVMTNTGTGPALIRGTVTDDAGKPVSGACVSLQHPDAAPDQFSYVLPTTSDGTYTAQVDPGSYLIRFTDCSKRARWAPEWYSDSPDRSGAIAVVFDHGSNSDIDAVLERNYAPDVSLSKLHVEPTLLVTDAGPLPLQPGIHRQITVGLRNPTERSWPVDLIVVGCPRTVGECRTIVHDQFALRPGRASEVYDWNAAGWFGDVEIRAEVTPSALPDPNEMNNRRTARTYVVLGGTGAGVAP